MAYDSGILLAAGGDVYTQLMDVIKAFCETAGWTTNLYDDDESYYDYANNYTWHATGGYVGKRLHMQKTINGTARFINIRSIQDQSPFRGWYSDAGLVNGLAIQGSTGYAAENRWDKQPGADYPYSTYTTGGVLTALPEDSLQYYIFSYDNGNNIYLQCANGYGYVGFVFGVTSYDVFIVGGSASSTQQNAGVTRKNALLFHAYQNYSDDAFWAYIGSTWYKLAYSTSVGCRLPEQSLQYIPNESSYPNPAGLLLYSSPDSFKGNAPLIPVKMMVAQTTGVCRWFGTLPGIKYVNMKNIASLTEETYGADTYKFFRQYNVDDSDQKFGGLAFLIS